MIRTCERCNAYYDDAVCFTLCPHVRFISRGDAQRKDLAFSLMGKEVRFISNPEGGLYKIRSVNHVGMVEVVPVQGGAVLGPFSPEIFMAVEAKEEPMSNEANDNQMTPREQALVDKAGHAPINRLFQSYGLNVTGQEKLRIVSEAFSDLVHILDTWCMGGREMSIVYTKLQEAHMFARRAVAMDERNQKDA